MTTHAELVDKVASIIMNMLDDCEPDHEFGIRAIREWSLLPHDGECIDVPMTCSRCVAENYKKIATTVMHEIGNVIEKNFTI